MSFLGPANSACRGEGGRMRMTVQSICAWMSGWRPPFCQGSHHREARREGKVGPTSIAPPEFRRKSAEVGYKTGFRRFIYFLSIWSLKMRFPGALPPLAGGGASRAFVSLNKETQGRSQGAHSCLGTPLAMCGQGQQEVNGLTRSCE